MDNLDELRSDLRSALVEKISADERLSRAQKESQEAEAALRIALVDFLTSQGKNAGEVLVSVTLRGGRQASYVVDYRETEDRLISVTVRPIIS